MRKLIACFLAAFALASVAAIQRQHAAAVEHQSSGTSYLFSDDLNGTGAPSGMVSVGSPNFDYATSPAPLEGTESLLSSSTSNYGSVDLGTGYAEIWFFFEFTLPDISVNPYMFRLLAADGTTTVAGGRITSTGAFRATNGTTTQATGTAAAYANGNVRYAWGHILQSGTSSADVLEIYVSSTTTKPGSASGTDGVTASTFTLTSAENVRYLAFNPGTTTNLIVDMIRVDDADIGSSPP